MNKDKDEIIDKLKHTVQDLLEALDASFDVTRTYYHSCDCGGSSMCAICNAHRVLYELNGIKFIGGINNTIKVDEAGVEHAIKNGRKAILKKEAIEAGFYLAEKPSLRDKLLILLNLGREVLNDWYESWAEIRARIWTKLGR